MRGIVSKHGTSTTMRFAHNALGNLPLWCLPSSLNAIWDLIRHGLTAGAGQPAHTTQAVRRTPEVTGIEVAWLPCCSTELNPCADLWRPQKRVVAANRVYPSLDEVAKRAVAWLTDLSAEIAALRLAGLHSSTFNWLFT